MEQVGRGSAPDPRPLVELTALPMGLPIVGWEGACCHLPSTPLPLSANRASGFSASGLATSSIFLSFHFSKNMPKRQLTAEKSGVWVSRPGLGLETDQDHFLRSWSWSWSRPCWSWSWSWPPWSWSRSWSRPVWSWSWSRRVVLSQT